MGRTVGAKTNPVQKRLAVALLYDSGLYSLEELGQVFEVAPSTVSAWVRRRETWLGTDRQIVKLARGIQTAAA